MWHNHGNVKNFREWRGIYRVGYHDKRTNQHSAYEIYRVTDALHAVSSAGNRFECHHFCFCLWKQNEKCTARDCFFHAVYNHDNCTFFFFNSVLWLGPLRARLNRRAPRLTQKRTVLLWQKHQVAGNLQTVLWLAHYLKISHQAG